VEDKMEQELVNRGFRESCMYFTNGKVLVMEVLGRWYQVHLNPYTLQTEQVEISCTADISDNKEYTPVVKFAPKDTPKKKPSKPLLPQHFVKKSEKWYQDTSTGKFWTPENVAKRYIIP